MSDALATLRRVVRRPAKAAVERCEMCTVEIDPAHGHVVDLQSRQLLCACRPCYLLFTDEHAHLRYRAVPDRYAALGTVFDERAWEELQIPVGLAFLFHNSALGRMVLLYPGPAGATESELDFLSAESAASPTLFRVGATPPPAYDNSEPQSTGGDIDLRPDVEALLVRRGEPSYIVPIDACYELIGRLRTLWRGFDGGQEAHAAVAEFFERIRARAS
ncbi:DUF5947 family protein [Actinoplanes sp. CA-030573]|uniref:DUF5947 family protein n=1 Tax=Actinoplanes sp. CA-030573 TaxID=3239898 RepID=UPI003D902D27